jgi:hypothetical protein
MSLSDERALLQSLLSEGAVPLNSVSKKLKGFIEQLCMSGATRIAIPTGKRSQYLAVRHRQQIEKRAVALAAVELKDDASVRALSIQTHQDSKQGGRLPYVLLNVLGSDAVEWSCDKYPEPRALAMSEMGFCGFILKEPSDECAWRPHGPVVFVENREAWVTLSANLPDELKGAAVIRYEGWLSKRMLAHIQQWRQASIWLFADYDPVGFANLKALREQGINAKMLIPQLEERVLRTCANEQIWNDNLALIPGVEQWIHQAAVHEQQLWHRLCEKGVALEHEIVVSLPGLCWET